MNILSGLQKLLGGKPSTVSQVHPLLQYLSMLGRNGQATGVYPGAPLGGGRRIPAQGADGFNPQDNSVSLADFADPLNVSSYLQQSYRNPQASVHGGYQQNQGINYFGNPAPQNLQVNADPFGWNNNQGIVKNFRVQ